MVGGFGIVCIGDVVVVIEDVKFVLIEIMFGILFV